MISSIIFIMLLIGQTPVNPWGLKWNANVEADLSGYKVYTTITQGENYDLLEDVPLANLSNVANPDYKLRLNEFLDGGYWAVVTAYDKYDNESGYSNEVSFIVDQSPPEPPSGCEIIINININR